LTENEWMLLFSRTVSQLMYDQRISQAELARETGLGDYTISRYLNRRRMPNIANVLKIAYVLRCDVEDLIDFGDVIE
jgi:transcriptional regulator with XRE-family HTH domain